MAWSHCRSINKPMYTVLSHNYDPQKFIIRNASSPTMLQHKDSPPVQEEWRGAKSHKFTSSLKTFDMPRSWSQITLVPERKIITNYTKNHPTYESTEMQERVHRRKLEPIPQRPLLKHKNIIPTHAQRVYYQNRKFFKEPYLLKPERTKGIACFYSSDLTKEISKEFHIEEIMTRKKRCFWSDFEKSQNKYSVEYQSGFYQKGELIPGSSNVLNLRKNCSIKENNSWSTIDWTKKIWNPWKKWKIKCKKEELTKDISYVCNWYSNDFEKELIIVGKDKKDKGVKVIGKNTNNTKGKK